MSEVAATATRGTIIHVINKAKDYKRMRTTTYDYVQLQWIQHSPNKHMIKYGKIPQLCLPFNMYM